MWKLPFLQCKKLFDLLDKLRAFDGHFASVEPQAMTTLKRDSS